MCLTILILSYISVFFLFILLLCFLLFFIFLFVLFRYHVYYTFIYVTYIMYISYSVGVMISVCVLVFCITYRVLRYVLCCLFTLWLYNITFPSLLCVFFFFVFFFFSTYRHITAHSACLWTYTQIYVNTRLRYITSRYARVIAY